VAYRLLRRALFSLDAERAHTWTLAAIGAAPRLLGALARQVLPPPDPSLARAAFGLRLRGPIGLAAGLDKEGVGITFWSSLGFGFIEIGTVTAHPQPGNPRPRLFRLPDDRAIINRMGFNNRGSEALALRMRELRERGTWPDVPVGANVGKSKVTPLADAVADYVLSVRRLQGLADYFTVNVSSPNTPGLRDLQDREALTRLLPAVLEAARGTPVLLKLSPDLPPEAIADAVSLACELGVSGIIATNTTITRPSLRADPGQDGGLSGAPLWTLARHGIQAALEASAGRIPVVGVGGIERADQVRELLDAGCVAVQVYSAMIYQGPALPSRLHRELTEPRV
jgi:dihydroorotate dehydrogenase